MKNLQNKILLIFFAMGITIILGMGLFFTNIVNQSNVIIAQEGEITAQAISQNMDLQITQTKILILGTILVFSCIVFVMGIFVSKVIVMPINRLIKNAQKIAKGDNLELIEIDKKKKKKRRHTEVEVLTNIIGIMTGELKQNLSDVDKQKREIEAILLHMNDGILAFDENGKIMHINPAAKELLNIENENTFDQIFKKLNLEIKMDAIMYLENWTKTEQKINIGDKTVSIYFATY